MIPDDVISNFEGYCDKRYKEAKEKAEGDYKDRLSSWVVLRNNLSILLQNVEQNTLMMGQLHVNVGIM